MTSSTDAGEHREAQPEAVFTPRVPAGELMFVSRSGDRASERLAEALADIGAQIIVHGDTGVGKTTLVAAIGGDDVARIECLSTKSFADIVRDALGAMGAVRELQITERDATTKGHDVGGGLDFVVSLKAELRTRTDSEEVRTLEVIQQPLVDALLDAMAAAGKRILFPDNFENVQSESVRREVAELMTAFADRSPQTWNTKIVVAGIAEVASDLVTSIRSRTL